jgi:5-methylcytosine-specific restriction endonuclease McrA
MVSLRKVTQSGLLCASWRNHLSLRLKHKREVSKVQSDKMIFDPEKIMVRWVPASKKHYEALGYSASMWSCFEVFVRDLPNGSNIRVNAVCPICGKKRFSVFFEISRRGNTLCQSCSNTKDLSGQRFGRLTVVERKLPTAGHLAKWVCACDCGAVCDVRSDHLSLGMVRSCGCFSTESKQSRRGEFAPNWNSRLTENERLQGHHVSGMYNWKRIVKDRDNHTCQVCGNRGTHAHHLDSFREHPESRTDPCNGVTLCADCHKRFHTIYGRSKTTRVQFDEFRKAYASS